MLPTVTVTVGKFLVLETSSADPLAALDNASVHAGSVLLYVVTRHSPLPITVQHGSNGLDGGLFMLKAALVLILAAKAPARILCGLGAAGPTDLAHGARRRA